MDVAAIKNYLNDHPEGIRIRMIDGHEYRIPHRDFILFLGRDPDNPSRPSRITTNFSNSHPEGSRMINTLLIAEVSGLGKNGRPRKARAKLTPKTR